MSNSVDPDETAHYEPSHLDLRCLQKPVIISCGSERVKHAAADPVKLFEMGLPRLFRHVCPFI